MAKSRDSRDIDLFLLPGNTFFISVPADVLVSWFIFRHLFRVSLSHPFSTGTINKSGFSKKWRWICTRTSAHTMGFWWWDREGLKSKPEVWQIISVKALGRASPSFWTTHSWLPVEVQRTASFQTSHWPGTWGTFSSLWCLAGVYLQE